MTFILVLACTIAACFALREPLRRRPVVFYSLAIAVDALFVASMFLELPQMLDDVLIVTERKCMLPLAMFSVIMYIGVLRRSSRAARWLRPVRAELSIIAWILSLGHMMIYLAAYAPVVASGNALLGNVLTSLLVAAGLFVLLLALGVTSFGFVKRHMTAGAWMRVQWLAYPFFVMVYAHLLFMLGPAALAGGAAAQVSVAVYSVVFVSYIVLRLWRAALDRNASQQRAVA